MSAFDRLHPALQHHIVNSLGWKTLRPLQEQAIEPILAGDDALLIAPTAAGKTEAAVFPVLSRILTERWGGLSVLYVCPLKALLNSLARRLQSYAVLIGRRVEVWHGDVVSSRRAKIGREPPDLLLATPESLEVMPVSQRLDHRAFFANLRAVIVDELHAFAGDDRGWHLLAVLARLTHLAGRELQRVALSATVGNPQQLIDWLCTGGKSPRRVINPPSEHDIAPEVQLDYVGSLPNAALVISRLHRGEKRLVFCDSRARVEELVVELRQRGIETFVSHSSLSRHERRRAETAFAEATDCVIVATSTLELGIDVGDLDRVIQIDAPYAVSSFLQRLGRSGRRPGRSRNCLFLTTTDEAFLRAAALLHLWKQGYVEPTGLAGRSRWLGTAQPMHIMLCQAVAEVLGGAELGVNLSQRAHAKLQEACAEHPWVEMAATALIQRQPGALEWWNFAGQLFNAALAGHFRRLGLEASYDHFAVTVRGNADIGSIRSAIEHLLADTSTALKIPVARTIWPELKFSTCVPDHLLTRMIASRMDQSSVLEMIQVQGLRVVHTP